MIRIWQNGIWWVPEAEYTTLQQSIRDHVINEMQERANHWKIRAVHIQEELDTLKEQVRALCAPWIKLAELVYEGGDED